MKPLKFVLFIYTHLGLNESEIFKATDTMTWGGLCSIFWVTEYVVCLFKNVSPGFNENSSSIQIKCKTWILKYLGIYYKIIFQ